MVERGKKKKKKLSKYEIECNYIKLWSSEIWLLFLALGCCLNGDSHFALLNLAIS